MPTPPTINRTVGSPAEGQPEKSYVASILGAHPAMFGGFPVTIVPGTPLSTADSIYVQGFNTFQLFISASGGSLAVDYGICHPATPVVTVLAFRNVLLATAVSVSMMMTWGAFGQTATALQGDLYTCFTLRLSASIANVVVNSCVLWCGVR